MSLTQRIESDGRGPFFRSTGCYAVRNPSPKKFIPDELEEKRRRQARLEIKKIIKRDGVIKGCKVSRGN